VDKCAHLASKRRRGTFHPFWKGEGGFRKRKDRCFGGDKLVCAGMCDMCAALFPPGLDSFLETNGSREDGAAGSETGRDV